MKKSIFIILILLISACFKVNAQQYSITSQYLTNGLIINPAYAGSREALSVNASYRKQWVRINGAPQFQNLTVHTPVNEKEKVSLGLMVNHMSYGITSSTGINAFYSYRIPVSKGKLSFGLSAGLDITSNKYNEAYVIDPSDNLFAETDVYTLPNFGAGAYYYSDKVFAGISIPSLLSFHSSGEDEYAVNFDYKRDQVFLTGGGLITVSSFLKIKPSFLIRYAVSDPLEADLNANLIIADAISVGGSYRIAEKAMVALLDLQVTPQLRLGYSYDYQTGQLKSYTSGTHEISIRYEFEFKVSAASPRYF